MNRKTPLKRNKGIRKKSKWPPMPKELKERLPQRCELCGKREFLTPAHRHERDWYYSQPERIWDYKQVMTLCSTKSVFYNRGCHMYLDINKRLREQFFIEKRGKE
jgi:hypothetical protein